MAVIIELLAQTYEMYKPICMHRNYQASTATSALFWCKLHSGAYPGCADQLNPQLETDISI
jgi:hypothetical protein